MDLRLRFGSMPPWLGGSLEASARLAYASRYRDERGEPALGVWALAGGDYVRLRFTEGHEFLVDRSGRELWAAWRGESRIDDTVSYLLGPVLGFVLRLRGILPLHASAVAVGGHAVAFVGPEGAGKSTIAAAFAARGHPVLSDDLAALCEVEGSPGIQPGFPWLRLRPDGATALSASSRLPPPLTPTGDRLYLDLALTRDGYRFEPEALPIGAVYLLGEHSTDPAAPAVEAVGPADAVLALVNNTWGARLLDEVMRAREFDVVCRLVGRSPVRRLRSHDDPARLAELCELILEDSAAFPAPRGAARGAGP